VAWKKESDTAAHHPIVTRAMTMVDWPERLTGHDFGNLLWGIISRAATQSAQYKTDYVVKAGTLYNTAGENWRHWVAVAVRTGYLAPVDLDGGEETWLLVEDSEDLFHIRRKAEIEWETARKRDNSNLLLVVPVRLRDGDGCRFCGVVVNWRARRGGRAGTYDHRIPGRGAQGPEDLRVACAACNGRRKDLAEDADAAVPPLSPPASPFYGEETAELLAEHGHQVPLSNPPRPRTRRDPAATTGDPAAGRTPPSTTGITQRPGSRPDPAQRPESRSGTARKQRPASRADPAPAPPAPPATPHPAGPRTPQSARASPSVRGNQRPGNQPDTAPEQHKPRPAETAGREHTPVRSPGRVRDGSGTGREAVPAVPATGRKRSRSRGRRGRPPRPPHGKEADGQGN
jgi:hypothetical protein